MKNNQFIPGHNAVMETLLHRHHKIIEICVEKGRRGVRIRELKRLAEEKGVLLLFKEPHFFDRHVSGIAHQGVMAIVEEFSYSNLEKIIGASMKNSEKALIIAADHINDEGNLGALIRTAAFFSADGLIIPKDRSAKITEKVIKRSSGACAYLSVSMVVNLGRTLDTLKKEGFWIIGAAGESSLSIYNFDWDRDLVLVLGSEDKGLSRSVRGHCDELVGIPFRSKMGSLNVSVACGVILGEIIRQRRDLKSK